MQPDFLIIGAPKTGSTWLTQTLADTPGVCMPTHEIHYFSRFYRTRSWEWYARHFDGARPDDLVGENSNSYLADASAAERIRSHLQDAKLVAILRHPVERAYSGYCMRFGRGKVGTDIASYLDPDRAADREILELGNYNAQLERYFALFRERQIHVILFEDMFANTENVLAQLGTFLRLAESEVIRPFAERVNARRSSGLPLAVKRALWPILRNEELRRPLATFLRNSGLWRGVEALSAQPMVYPTLPQDLRSRMSEYYRDDVRRLSRLLGRDLSAWFDGGPEAHAGPRADPALLVTDVGHDQPRLSS